MNLRDITILNISRYLFPFPPHTHTLNWGFWTHMASKAKKVCLISTVSCKNQQTYHEGNLEFIGIPAFGTQVAQISRFLISGHRLGKAIVSQNSPAIVWASDDIWGNIVASRLARRFKAPYLLELQGNVFSPSSESGSLSKRIFQQHAVAYGVQTATRVRVCCENHKERMPQYGGHCSTHVIPTRVDSKLFTPGASFSKSSRDKMGITDQDTIFISVCSLVTRKGVHVFLDAFRQILADLPRAQYWIIGDGPLRQHLQIQAARFNGRVRFLGRLPHAEVREKLAAADIFVLPSFAEGMPRAVQEAQAMGLPVIATQVDGIPEQMVDGVTGILVPPGDSDALHSAALALNNRNSRIEMGLAGRRHVLTHFDQPAVFEKWTTLLETMAAELNT